MQRIAAGSDSQIQDVAVNEPVSLATGDVLIVRNENDQIWTAGPADIDIVTAVMTTGSNPGSYDPDEWIGNGSALDDNTLALPGGPYRLTLRQMAVEAATGIPLPAEGITQLGLIQEGKATIGRGSDGTLSITLGTTPSDTVLILSLSRAEVGSGTPVALPADDQ